MGLAYNEKRERAEEIEQSIQEKIRTLGEKN